MRVRVHAADEGGCGWYRMMWPAQYAAEAGYDVYLDESRQINVYVKQGDDGLPHAMELGEDLDCDVLILQRPLARMLSEIIPLVQAKGIAVVVELDDDFVNVHQRNVAWRHSHPDYSPDRNWKHLKRACSLADQVVVTTPKLADVYARHGRVSVVPNYLPDHFKNVTPADQSQLTIGWSGTVATHPTDLQVLQGLITQVLAKHDAKFRVVGTGKGVGYALGMKPESEGATEEERLAAWKALDASLGSDWAPLEQYPQAMADTFNVGVVPLDMIPFNQAKSWLKGLEMAACGIPFVASATEPYKELQRLGIGRIADRPRDWLKQLEIVITQRDQLAVEWRERALSKMMLRDHIDEWISAWTLARINRMRSAR